MIEDVGESPPTRGPEIDGTLGEESPTEEGGGMMARGSEIPPLLLGGTRL